MKKRKDNKTYIDKYILFVYCNQHYEFSVTISPMSSNVSEKEINPEQFF